MIQVIFQNGREGEVEAPVLARLLDSGDIRSFRRNNGWVDPTFDPIRRNPLYVFSLPERRSEVLNLMTSSQSLPMNEQRLPPSAAECGDHDS